MPRFTPELKEGSDRDAVVYTKPMRLYSNPRNRVEVSPVCPSRRLEGRPSAEHEERFRFEWGTIFRVRQGNRYPQFRGCCQWPGRWCSPRARMRRTQSCSWQLPALSLGRIVPVELVDSEKQSVHETDESSKSCEQIRNRYDSDTA
jgi:hypothetical protein